MRSDLEVTETINGARMALANRIGVFVRKYATLRLQPIPVQTRCPDVMWADLRHTPDSDHRLCSVELD